MLNRYKILFWLLLTTAFLCLITAIGGYFYINSLFSKLPKFEKLENYEPSLITRVYSNDGTIIKEFYDKFKNTDSVYYSYPVSMLLTLSLFTKNIYKKKEDQI